MARRRLATLLSLLVLVGVVGALAFTLLRDHDAERDSSPGAARSGSGSAPGDARLEGRAGEGSPDAPSTPNPDGEAEGEEAPADAGLATGRVVGPDGRPVHGVTVGYDTPWGARVDEVEADDEGGFQFHHVADHEFTVVAVAPGHCVALGPRIRMQAGQTVDVGTLCLAKGYAIRGRVVDPQGEPAEGVEVAIETEADPVPETWQGMWSALEDWWNQTTDEDGSFVFEHLPEGVYRVMAAYGDSSSWSEVREHVRTGTDDVLFVSPGAMHTVDARIKVMAVGPDGERIPRFQARILCAGGGSGSGWASKGVLEIGSEDMQAPVRLAVWDAHDEEGERYGYGAAYVESVEAREEPYVVKLEPAGHIAGRVLWDGEPMKWQLVANGRLDAHGRLARLSEPDVWDLPSLYFHTKTDESGAFRFVGLPPGEVAIELQSNSGPGRLESRSVTVEVGRTDVVLRMIPTGKIHVRVFAPEGQKFRQGSARLEKYVAAGLASWGSVSTGGNQEYDHLDFDFDNLDLGSRYRVSATAVVAGRNLPETILDDITPREERYELHLTDGLSISGRVVRDDRTPVAGAEVHFRPCPAGWFQPWARRLWERRYWTATTREDGTFELTGMRPEDVFLTVSVPGLTDAAPPPRIAAGTRGVTLVVVPERRISGHVEDPSGKPVDELSVAALRAQDDVGLWTSTSVSADGFFEVSGLHPGSWRIVGWHRWKDDDPRYVLSEPVSAGTRGLRLVARTGTVLSGVVRDAEGAVVPGASVWLISPWSNRECRTDADGAYAFSGVPPGRCEVVARAPSGAVARRTLSPEPEAETTTLDVEIR